MNFSLEIGPKTEIETVPPIRDIYVTMLPGGDYRETADKAVELVKKGFNPVPHFPARSMQNEGELKEYVDRCKDGGVTQALIIGGGREPVGKFESSFQLLETGLDYVGGTARKKSDDNIDFAMKITPDPLDQRFLEDQKIRVFFGVGFFF